MSLTGHEFRESVRRLTKSWFPARSIVEAAVSARKSLHESGEIMMLDRYCPWQGHLSDIEKELNIEGSLKYVLFEDSGGSCEFRPYQQKGLPRGKHFPRLGGVCEMPSSPTLLALLAASFATLR